MPMIKIDGQDYDTEKMNEEAKKQLGSLQFVDRKIAELQAEIAVMQTARAAYGRALMEQLKNSKENVQ